MSVSSTGVPRIEVPLHDVRVRTLRKPFPARRGWVARVAGGVPQRALLALAIAGCMVATFALM